MFVVVEFPDSNEVEAVPEDWLLNNETVYWPPYKNSSKIRKCIEQEIPHESIWKINKCRVLFSGLCYEKAKNKALKAEIGSDLNSEVEGNKRKRSATVRYGVDADYEGVSDSQSEHEVQDAPTHDENSSMYIRKPCRKRTARALCSSDSDDNDDTFSHLNNLPSFATFSKSYESQNVLNTSNVSTSEPISTSHLSNTNTSVKKSNNFANEISSTKSAKKATVDIITSRGLHHESFFNNFEKATAHNSEKQISRDSLNRAANCNETFSNVHDLPMSSKSHGCTDCIKLAKRFETLENAILKYIEEQRQSIKEIRVLFLHEIQVPESFSFVPVTSVEDFNELLACLKDNIKHESLVTFLSVSTSQSLSDSVRRIIYRLFDHKFLITTSWAGRNKKLALKDTAVVQLICTVIRRQPSLKSSSDDAIFHKIKVIVKASPDHGSGRKHFKESVAQDNLNPISE